MFDPAVVRAVLGDHGFVVKDALQSVWVMWHQPATPVISSPLCDVRRFTTVVSGHSFVSGATAIVVAMSSSSAFAAVDDIAVGRADTMAAGGRPASQLAWEGVWRGVEVRVSGSDQPVL